jgi:diguanylate cyclase (GGDEF)-like protein
VVGLAAGADDYVLKPFDPMELVARVRTTLARTSQLRETSPLTGLPGNHRISQEVARRLVAREPLAVVYADLSDFKAYNDCYGFLRCDEVILLTAETLRQAIADHADERAFLGHVGGDDFVVLCHPDEVRPICTQVVEQFDARIPLLYDPEDRERGYLEVKDRQGELRRFGLVTIALGVATTERRSFGDPREIVAVATEMKAFLKRSRDRSAWAVDGRRD